MDLKKRLELGQSKSQTNEIVEYVDGRRDRFKLLVEVYKEGPFRLTQRAAWPLTICVEKWPYLLDPHFKTLLNFLHDPHVHDAFIRNTFRLLQYVDVPKRFQGEVADHCFRYLQDRKVAIAIRVFSMTVLNNITRGQPELRNELKLILEDQILQSSAAFRSRGRKVLKEIG